MAVVTSSRDTKQSLLTAYAAAPYNCVPLFPFFLYNDGGSSVAKLFGQPTSAGPSWILTPNRKFVSTGYTESTLKNNIQKALAEKKTLTVESGGGAGSYLEGTKVSISATTGSGKVFQNWESTPSGIVENPTSPTTKVTMPATAASVKAIYKPVSILDKNIAAKGNNLFAGASIENGQLKFSVSTAAQMKFTLYSPAGRELVQSEGFFTEGSHSVSLGGTTISQGIYLLNVSSENRSVTGIIRY